MKSVVQNYRTGELKILNIPVPIISPESILVKTINSLISSGTERTKIETARMTLIEKAITRLDLVKTLMNNIKQEGLIFTLKKAFNKLDTTTTLGYSCAGEVIDIGNNIKEFRIGDRVACVGEGYATHSEINLVPQDFAVKIPDKVSYEEASFVGLGAISLNAVELAQVLSDEKVAVIGLGLIGQIIVQILKAKGCKVFGVEIDEGKIELAKKLGLDKGVSPIKEDILISSQIFTDNLGFDAVIISAASKNNLPIEIAGKILRYKGRVILVGAMPIIIPRKDYYEKELYFVISSGFGAGLYYKIEKERNYPYNYRPISVKENMQNFLNLVAEKKIDVKSLITHRFRIEEAEKAYELIRNNKEKYIGIIFEYEKDISYDNKVSNFENKETKKEQSTINIGFIGAGSFAQGYLLPLLKRDKNVILKGVATASSVNCCNVARKFGFKYYTTDYREILKDPEIEVVFITTRHNLHTQLVVEALREGKKIFVEKPLCLNEEELRSIIYSYQEYKKIFNKEPVLMVGFNRRFSPFMKKVKDFFKNRTGHLDIVYRINAGYLPAEHWLLNPEIGGGRILGEVCHFLDLLQFITKSIPIQIYATGDEQNVVINIEYEDKSKGVIIYNSKGDLSFPRERIEIFGDGSVVIIDNFNKAIFSRSGIKEKMQIFGRDMGYNNEIKIFIDNLKKGLVAPIEFNDLIINTLTTFLVKESQEKNKIIKPDFKEWLIA